MKRLASVSFVLLILSLFLANGVTAMDEGKMKTASGKVTAVDPQGMGIVISATIGAMGAMDVGTIVDKDTMIKVQGKTAGLSDIEVGDSVTIRHLKSDDLYAKEITKK